MNFEKKVYDIVKSNPRLKDFLKYSYQRFWSLVSKKQHQVLDDFLVREHSFFGFHDKSPWSSDNRYLLSHTFTGIGNESLENIESVDVCIFTGNSWLEKKIIGTTRAFNWQQGSQLQWLSDSEIIFNDFVDGKCVARIVNCEGQNLKNLRFSIGTISPVTRMYCGYCFETFGLAMSGYGYNFRLHNAESTITPLHLVLGNVDNPDSFKIIDCTKLDNSLFNGVSNGKLCLSHALFSPQGEKLTFMKRLSEEGKRLQSEMYVYDCKNESLLRIPFKDMVSHYTYLDDNRILVYANTDLGDNYYIVNLGNFDIENVSSLTNDRDGHPSCSAFGRVVFDTYPDKSRHQSLYLWDNKRDKAKPISKLYAPLNFRDDARVDLHPRIRKDGRYVCLDTSFNGIRSLATMKLPG